MEAIRDKGLKTYTVPAAAVEDGRGGAKVKPKVIQMSNLQLRKEVRDNIEFFVSNDGEQVGMSALGLATLTGVSSASIDVMVKAFSIPGKLPSETLEEARNHYIARGVAIQAVPNPNGVDQ